MVACRLNVRFGVAAMLTPGLVRFGSRFVTCQAECQHVEVGRANKWQWSFRATGGAEGAVPIEYARRHGRHPLGVDRDNDPASLDERR